MRDVSLDSSESEACVSPMTKTPTRIENIIFFPTLYIVFLQ
jgi:hypothetical protein